MITVDDVAQTGLDQLQSIVDTAETASASLRAQSDDLTKQIQSLQNQDAAIQAQIREIEGTDVEAARTAIVNISTLRKSPQAPLAPRGELKTING